MSGHFPSATNARNLVIKETQNTPLPAIVHGKGQARDNKFRELAVDENIGTTIASLTRRHDLVVQRFRV